MAALAADCVVTRPASFRETLRPRRRSRARRSHRLACSSCARQPSMVTSARAPNFSPGPLKSKGLSRSRMLKQPCVMWPKGFCGTPAQLRLSRRLFARGLQNVSDRGAVWRSPRRSMHPALISVLSTQTLRSRDRKIDRPRADGTNAARDADTGCLRLADAVGA